MALWDQVPTFFLRVHWALDPMVVAEGPGVPGNPSVMLLSPSCHGAGVSSCFTESWSGTEGGSPVWLSPVLTAAWNWPYSPVCKAQKQGGLRKGHLYGWWWKYSAVPWSGRPLNWKAHFPLVSRSVEGSAWARWGPGSKCFLFQSPVQDAGIQTWPTVAEGLQMGLREPSDCLARVKFLQQESWLQGQWPSYARAALADGLPEVQAKNKGVTTVRTQA